MSKVKALCEEHNVSLTKLARETGISRGHIHNIVAGHTNVTMNKLEAIADYFGVFVGELIGELDSSTDWCDYFDVPDSLREFAETEPGIQPKDINMLNRLYKSGCIFSEAYQWRTLWIAIKGILE